MTAVSTSLDLTVTLTAAAHQGGMIGRQINSQLKNVYSVIFSFKQESRQEDTAAKASLLGKLFIQKQDQKDHLPKWLVELTLRLPISGPYLAGWRMLISSPGGMTCGSGMDCGGQVLLVWKHKDRKFGSKIRFPNTERRPTCF